MSIRYVEEAIKELLELTPEVFGLLNPNGGDIQINIVDESTPFPSIVIRQIQKTPTRVKGGIKKGPDLYRFSIQAWDEDLGGAKRIMEEVSVVLDGYTGKVGTFQLRVWKDGQEGLREDEIGPEGIHGEAHDYLIRHQY